MATTSPSSTTVARAAASRQSAAAVVVPSLARPLGAVRPRWSSASALMYAGMIVVLASTVGLVVVLAPQQGDGGLFGLTTLIVAALTTLAAGARRLHSAVSAGLLAFVAVIASAIWAGTLFAWIGFLPDESSSLFAGLEPSFLLIAATTFAVALAAFAWFRTPLLVLPAAVASWYAFVDLAGGDRADQRAGASIVVGALLVALAIAVDRHGRRPAAFWLHTTGGIALVGAVLQQATTTTDWLIVAAVAVALLVLAYVLGRSSYAVLAIVGLLATANYFISSWYEADPLGWLFGGFGMQETAVPLLYALAGSVLIALGLAFEAMGVRASHGSDDRQERHVASRA